MDKYEILDILNEEDIQFIRLQFTDISGTLKNITVTRRHIEDVIDRAYVFSANDLYSAEMKYAEELYLRPDLNTFAILPENTQQGKIARILCDVVNADGEEFPLSPRHILKRTIAAAEEMNCTFYVDSECQFFMFHRDDNGLPTTITHDRAVYLDSAPLDIGITAKRNIVQGLEEMGFDIASFHHAAAPAQHEILFSEAEALQAADQVVSLRNAVGSIARSHGLHATFMPKPTVGSEGSGMHLTLSIYKDDRNIFNAVNEDGSISDYTRHFIGGILKHAKAMCLITNPLVNSYKRIVTGINAPQNIDWSTKAENTLLRVKKRPGEDRRIELCMPDSSADPYLSICLMIAAGVDGIRNKIEPTKEGICCDDKLPETLGEAIQAFEADDYIIRVLGSEFAEKYIEIKRNEWKSYMSQVSNWEVENYLYRT